MLHRVTIVLEVPKQALREQAGLFREEQWHAQTPKQALTSPAPETAAV